MDPNLQHPSPRLPEGWKGYQSDNIDIIPSSELGAKTGRHSRSPSVLSNHNYPVMNIQPSQLNQQSNDGNLYIDSEIIAEAGIGVNDDPQYGSLQFVSDSTTTNNNVSGSFGQISLNEMYLAPSQMSNF